jgi:hypothetical protein
VHYRGCVVANNECLSDYKSRSFLGAVLYYLVWKCYFGIMFWEVEVLEKDNTSNEKAVTLAIDSMKLYITIDIGLIAVLITFFIKVSATVLPHWELGLFMCSLLFALTSIIMGVAAIDDGVFQVVYNMNDISNTSFLKDYRITIYTFFCSLMFAAVNGSE